MDPSSATDLSTVANADLPYSLDLPGSTPRHRARVNRARCPSNRPALQGKRYPRRYRAVWERPSVQGDVCNLLILKDCARSASDKGDYVE